MNWPSLYLVPPPDGTPELNTAVPPGHDVVLMHVYRDHAPVFTHVRRRPDGWLEVAA